MAATDRRTWWKTCVGQDWQCERASPKSKETRYQRFAIDRTSAFYLPPLMPLILWCCFCRRYCCLIKFYPDVLLWFTHPHPLSMGSGLLNVSSQTYWFRFLPLSLPVIQNELIIFSTYQLLWLSGYGSIIKFRYIKIDSSEWTWLKL